ncbi:hypothetical protein HA402_008571 [Bradysia odoriphaga]|nr:hypothetical protein HA402_008571 [Bradysia odoriphaga]
MKEIVSRRKSVPIRRSMVAQYKHSKTDSLDAQRIGVADVDDIEEMQQHNDPFNDTAEATDNFTDVDTEIDRKSPDCDISSYVEAVLEDPKQNEHESEDGQTPGDAEPEFVSTNNLPPLRVSNKRKSRRSNGRDALNDEQSNRVDESEGSSRKKKQVRVRVKRCDFTEKNPVARDSKFSLRIHFKESKTFPCTECDKQFNHKGHLEEHFRIHTREKPFTCKDCGFAFSQKGHLTAHQRTHSGERPFECLICNVAFSQKSNLTHHMLIHKNERPFTCEICNRSFRRRDRLTHHHRTHGEKPHKCAICLKTFRQRSHLVSHLKKIHDELPN